MYSNMNNLAELTGILLGDGSLSLKDNNLKSINRLKITLNSQSDKFPCQIVGQDLNLGENRWLGLLNW